MSTVGGPPPGSAPGPPGGESPDLPVGDLPAPGGPRGDLPEAAVRRLESSAFSSGLSVPDFAACLELGLEPVALVQGFCVMQGGWYGAGSGYMRGMQPYGGQPDNPGDYSETYRCPHGYVSMEHRAWGQNFEQPWVEQAWAQGYGTSYARMVEEAQQHGAHGIIGVVDRVSNVADTGTTEFHFLGTAVTVDGGPPPAGGVPWTTYLAGQRLAKSIEAGFMPVAVVASLASVRVWAYCMTEYLMEGTMAWGGPTGPQLVGQITKAHMAVRQLARKHVRQQLVGDELHGATIEVTRRELSQGDEVIDCTLRGNRVRRFKDFDPIALPRPTVRLG
ncbi:MAG TPA: heavy metal-binding domain-containing protein [Acidimicrobiales bacterium]|nr:heavy metal-binding domain-containing protein [Acidimicrobiales bacterium]